MTDNVIPFKAAALRVRLRRLEEAQRRLESTLRAMLLKLQTNTIEEGPR